MGFLPEEEKNSQRTIGHRGRRDIDLLSRCSRVDLIKFGFIPEFIGRMPVVAVLEDLDKDALVQILTKPKNAIIRQYQKLFEFENVRLKFSDDALEAIADLAMERKVGARGLRMILEDLMLDLMYYLPSYKKVREFLVTKEMVHVPEDQPYTIRKGRLSQRRAVLSRCSLPARPNGAPGQPNPCGDTCLPQRKNPTQSVCR